MPLLIRYRSSAPTPHKPSPTHSHSLKASLVSSSLVAIKTHRASTVCTEWPSLTLRDGCCHTDEQAKCGRCRILTHLDQTPPLTSPVTGLHSSLSLISPVHLATLVSLHGSSEGCAGTPKSSMALLINSLPALCKARPKPLTVSLPRWTRKDSSSVRVQMTAQLDSTKSTFSRLQWTDCGWLLLLTAQRGCLAGSSLVLPNCPLSTNFSSEVRAAVSSGPRGFSLWRAVH